jgi:putative restriction endonuclease
VTSSAGELQIREIIAATLMGIAERRGGFLLWEDLQAVRLPTGAAVRVVDPGRGGIWNPSNLEATLSILTSPDGPYADRELEGGLLRYSYQAGPEGGKNLELRRAMDLQLPLLRLNKVAKGTYVPIYPVYVVADDPDAREFTLAVDSSLRGLPDLSARSEIERRYAERVVRQRVHQPAFRARVMLAYDTRCAVCVLKHPPLLDAAHIIGDGEERGDAVVTNGLSLCKIHHAAYDENLIGISPEYRVVVRPAILEETDGPMLLHGLQEMHERQIYVPHASADRPDPARLQNRYEQFQSAS